MASIEEYVRRARVASYEVDAKSNLKLSVLLRMCQETSEQHLEAMGVGYETLRQKNIVFLITTNDVSISRLPRHKETVTIKTHPLGSAGAQFYRDFVIYSGEERLGRVLQLSVAADPSTHRILRPKSFIDLNIFPDAAVPREQQLGRPQLPPELALAGERPIYYSNLDFNEHLNNAIYGDIVLDFMCSGIEPRLYAHARIDYAKECRLGDTLRIYVGREGNTVYMRGDHDRGSSFTAIVETI